jgi:hypothetical protein
MISLFLIKGVDTLRGAGTRAKPVSQKHNQTPDLPAVSLKNKTELLPSHLFETREKGNQERSREEMKSPGEDKCPRPYSKWLRI